MQPESWHLHTLLANINQHSKYLNTTHATGTNRAFYRDLRDLEVQVKPILNKSVKRGDFMRLCVGF